MRLPGPIVIVGFMACGKSEVARALANQLGIAMVDLDELITAKAGRSPAVIIREEGEREFRRIESTTLEELLNKKEINVIALGGGAWIETLNRNLLTQYRATSIWLDVPFDLCWDRIESSGEDRPLGSTPEQAHTLYLQRRPIYEMANIRITVTSEDTPDQLAATIALLGVG